MAEVHQKRREVYAARQQVEASLALCAEHGFEYLQIRNTILYGWTLAMQGHEEQGIAQLRQGLAAYQSIGAEIFRPYYASLLAESYREIGDTAAGLAVIDEALTSIERTQKRCWAAESHRCKGELLLQEGHRHQGKCQRQKWLEAEQSFCQALDITQQQQAKSLELQASLPSPVWVMIEDYTAARERTLCRVLPLPPSEKRPIGRCHHV